MIKYMFWAVVATGAGLFMLSFLMPSLDSVTNDTVAQINSTWADTSNYTGLSDGIAFGPLLLWLGVFTIPLGLLAWWAWQRRYGGV